MNIDDMTIREAREIARMLGAQQPAPYPLPIGSVVCVQTIMLWYVGRLEAVDDRTLTLSGAAWAADTGRYSEFVATGEAREVEPLPDGVPLVIERGAVVACHPHPKQLRVLR